MNCLFLRIVAIAAKNFRDQALTDNLISYCPDYCLAGVSSYAFDLA